MGRVSESDRRMNDIFAFVSQRPCGCVNFMATVEWMFRHYPGSEVSNFVACGMHGKCRAVDVDEYNRLKMKCDSCYRKE